MEITVDLSSVDWSVYSELHFVSSVLISHKKHHPRSNASVVVTSSRETR